MYVSRTLFDALGELRYDATECEEDRVTCDKFKKSMRGTKAAAQNWHKVRDVMSRLGFRTGISFTMREISGASRMVTNSLWQGHLQKLTRLRHQAEVARGGASTAMGATTALRRRSWGHWGIR